MHAAVRVGQNVAAIGGPPPVPTTLNPADKAATITLSGGNLTAAANTGGLPTYQSARATSSRTVGAYYFEVRNNITTGDSCVIGVANALFNVNNGLGSDNNSYGYYGFGPMFLNSVIIATGATWRVVGEFAGCAVDLTNRLIWFRKCPAGIWNNNGAADPTTGVGGFAMAGPIGAGVPIFPGVSAFTPPNDNCTINFGATAFSGAVPAGFSPWL